jgi:vacuolar-type H+-ATPase subunit I/STV1
MKAKEKKKEQISSNKEVIENLQTQLKDYKEKAEYFNTMKLKAEGALEVLLQLESDKETK